MNGTSITAGARHQQPATGAGAGAGASAAIASLFGADAASASTSFSDQLALLNPQLRAAAAAAPGPAANAATRSAEPANGGGSLADAADEPGSDAMNNWIKDWLPAAGATAQGSAGRAVEADSPLPSQSQSQWLSLQPLQSEQPSQWLSLQGSPSAEPSQWLSLQALPSQQPSQWLSLASPPSPSPTAATGSVPSLPDAAGNAAGRTDPAVESDRIDGNPSLARPAPPSEAPPAAQRETGLPDDRPQPSDEADPSADRAAVAGETPEPKPQTMQPMPLATGLLPPLPQPPVDVSPVVSGVGVESTPPTPGEQSGSPIEADEPLHFPVVRLADAPTDPKAPVFGFGMPRPLPVMPRDGSGPTVQRHAAATAERVSASGYAPGLPGMPATAAAEPTGSVRASSGRYSASAADATETTSHTASAAAADTAASEQRHASLETTRSTAFAKVLEQASLPATIGQPPLAANAASASLPPLQLRLDTPFDAPEFPDALGVQVSVLARDGVEFAELSLNPAEMGPISIRIALDGQHAHVEFGVDSAATRAVLESGLPELASALREAGLTLTGGGVSEHARGQADASPHRQSGDNQTPEGRQARATGDDDLPREQPRPRRVQVAGGVDLYA